MWLCELRVMWTKVCLRKSCSLSSYCSTCSDKLECVCAQMYTVWQSVCVILGVYLSLRAHERVVFGQQRRRSMKPALAADHREHTLVRGLVPFPDTADCCLSDQSVRADMAVKPRLSPHVTWRHQVTVWQLINKMRNWHRDCYWLFSVWPLTRVTLSLGRTLWHEQTAAIKNKDRFRFRLGFYIQICLYVTRVFIQF